MRLRPVLAAAVTALALGAAQAQETFELAERPSVLRERGRYEVTLESPEGPGLALAFEVEPLAEYALGLRRVRLRATGLRAGDAEGDDLLGPLLGEFPVEMTIDGDDDVLWIHLYEALLRRHADRIPEGDGLRLRAAAIALDALENLRSLFQDRLLGDLLFPTVEMDLPLGEPLAAGWGDARSRGWPVVERETWRLHASGDGVAVFRGRAWRDLPDVAERALASRGEEGAQAIEFFETPVELEIETDARGVVRRGTFAWGPLRSTLRRVD